jgi:hypothetical protein
LKDDSKACFAIIRHNVRTYESGGVVAVVKGRMEAEVALKQYEVGQNGDEKHAGWRYFLEKSDLKAGIDPDRATQMRQNRLELREAEALSVESPIPFSRQN